MNRWRYSTWLDSFIASIVHIKFVAHSESGLMCAILFRITLSEDSNSGCLFLIFCGILIPTPFDSPYRSIIRRTSCNSCRLFTILEIRLNTVLAPLWRMFVCSNNTSQRTTLFWEYWTSRSSHLPMHRISLQVRRVHSKNVSHPAHSQRWFYCKTQSSLRAWMLYRGNITH